MPDADCALPRTTASEWGVFSDEGCLERELYGPKAVTGAIQAYHADDNAYTAPMCDCGEDGCECPQDGCECEDDEDS